VAKRAKVVVPDAPVADLAQWWQSCQVRGVVIGGLAIAVVAIPRTTHDVDALVIIPEADWALFLADAQTFGFVPRDPDALAFAKKSRMLLLRHKPSAIDIDITLGQLAFEEEIIARAVLKDVGGTKALVATPEDLVVMKAVADRNRDWRDIDGILATYPRLDVDRIRRWVREFAEVLETPEIVKELERRLTPKLIRKRSKGKK
jgi:predicted nucleotidyltransferase